MPFSVIIDFNLLVADKGWQNPVTHTETSKYQIMNATTEVVIVGAGPAGLALAISLSRVKVKVSKPGSLMF